MHAYKDAIPNSIGSYIIYPGSDDEIYYENNEKVESVGAFGLIPGEEKTEEIANFIKKIISYSTSENKHIENRKELVK